MAYDKSDGFMSEIKQRLAPYEFPAPQCGQRMVLKLTLEQALEVIERGVQFHREDEALEQRERDEQDD